MSYKESIQKKAEKLVLTKETMDKLVAKAVKKLEKEIMDDNFVEDVVETVIDSSFHELSSVVEKLLLKSLKAKLGVK